MDWWWNVQHVVGLVWVFPTRCGHAGEDGHKGQEDGRVLHFWIGFGEWVGFSSSVKMALGCGRGRSEGKERRCLLA